MKTTLKNWVTVKATPRLHLNRSVDAQKCLQHFNVLVSSHPIYVPVTLSFRDTQRRCHRLHVQQTEGRIREMEFGDHKIHKEDS
ncbi:hypothetical protein Trydic_g6842 [Trypoxylus dichotomus]